MDVLKVQKGVAQSRRLPQGAAIGSSLPSDGATMIDINNPEHVAALRWALDLKSKAGAKVTDPGLCATIMARVANPPHKWAFAALSSPASAAELIRSLVERAGCAAHAYLYDPDELDDEDGMDSAFVFTAFREPMEIWWSFEDEEDDDGENNIQISNAPAIIARLIALSPNAGAEAVLQALRGES